MNELKIVKRINKDVRYKAKNGKEYVSTNYYVVLPNGTWVPIQPTFKNGYIQLDTICEKIINGGK